MLKNIILFTTLLAPFTSFANQAADRFCELRAERNNGVFSYVLKNESFPIKKYPDTESVFTLGQSIRAFRDAGACDSVKQYPCALEAVGNAFRVVRDNEKWLEFDDALAAYQYMAELKDWSICSSVK